MVFINHIMKNELIKKLNFLLYYLVDYNYYLFNQLYTKMSEIDDNYCGVVRTYYDLKKTKLKEEYFINAGKKEGIYKEYYENGQLCVEVNYINGTMNGIYKLYYENGQLWEEMNYIDGKINGIFKSYYSNGQLMEEVNYIDDKRNGIYKSYHYDGQLLEEVNYIDGKKSFIINDFFRIDEWYWKIILGKWTII